MIKFDEITVNEKVVPLFVDSFEQMFVPLKEICEVLNIDFEKEKERIAQHSFLNTIFENDYCRYRYVLGYLGSIGLDQDRDIQIRKDAMKLHDKFYDDITEILPEA